MSEGRQIALLLVGLLVLGGLGFVGAALFPDECAPLEARGELVVGFEDAAGALAISASEGAELEALGTTAGLGAFRGAVVVPADASVLPAEGEFFLVTDDEFLVLRPGFGAVSPARDRVGAEVVPAHRALGLRAADGTTVLYDGELDDLRCGELVATERLLDVDRGISIVTDDDAVAAITLSGEEVWRRDLGAAPRWAWVVDRDVLVGTDDGVVELLLADGTTNADLGGAALDRVDARGSRVVAVDADGTFLLVDAEDDSVTAISEAGDTGRPVLVPGGVIDLRLVDGRLTVDGDLAGGSVPAPEGLAIEEVVAADDGMLAVLVGLGDRRVVLQWGPVQG